MKNEMDPVQNQEKSNLTLNVNDLEVILTPYNCASIINEILKSLLYHKCQIPYPYNWMKNVVDKKRKQVDDDDRSLKKNFTLINHFRVVSKTYDILEKAMKGIFKEFSMKQTIKEVVILFGATPQSAREAFSVEVSLVRKHSDRNHIAQLHKFQQEILRNIFLSETWIESMGTSITCTNTHIFLKKCGTNIDSSFINKEDELFIRTQPLNILPNIKQIKINLSSENIVRDCCKEFLVFGDTEDDSSEEINNDEYVWYRFKEHVQGFKDCYINKISASELW